MGSSHIKILLFQVEMCWLWPTFLISTLKKSCSMTFCFSFDVLTKFNPIQVNNIGGGPP